MADALFGDESMVGEWDRAAGLYLVRGWVAGPAGTAGLHLSGGVEVDIDVAWPSQLAELRIPASGRQLDDRTARVVDRLLGSVRLSRLLRVDSDVPRQLDADYAMTWFLPRDDSLLALSLSALAQQIGDDPAASPIRRGAALLEASILLRRTGGGLGLRATRASAFERGAELLLLSQNTALLPYDDTVRSELAMIVRGAVDANRRDGRAGVRLLTLADTLDARPFDVRRHPAAAASMPAMVSEQMAMPTMAAGARRARSAEVNRVSVDRRSLPSSLQSADVRARRVTTGEIEVRVIRGNDASQGCWARAFDGEGTMVAMAPLRPIEGDGGALLLVAPEIVHDLVVDVTDLPSVRRPSLALAATQAAITEGRAATSAERAGRVKDAAVAWRKSAVQWQEVGDSTRASTADRYASGTFTRRGTGERGDRVPPALVADRVDT